MTSEKIKAGPPEEGTDEDVAKMGRLRHKTDDKEREWNTIRRAGIDRITSEPTMAPTVVKGLISQAMVMLKDLTSFIDELERGLPRT